jgi:hypothetical protein
MRQVLVASVFALALVSYACGSSGVSTPAPTSTGSLPPSAVRSPQVSPTANGISSGNEAGEAPVFYRTADEFRSLTVGQPYKVLLRVTNDYAQPAIAILASCTSCVNQPSITLTGSKVTPVGEEAPGSYYPMTVVLPAAGHWELVVLAGRDTTRISVNVHGAAG